MKSGRPRYVARCFINIVMLSVLGCAHRDEWIDTDRVLEGIAAIAPPRLAVQPGHLSVEWHANGLCSVAADQVERAELVYALLEGSRFHYACPPYPLSGKVSLRLQQVSAIQVLNACLRDLELEAALLPSSPEVLVIRDAPERPESRNSNPPSIAGSISRHFSTIHRPSQDLVSSLFRGTPTTQGLLSSQAMPLEIAAAPEGNRIYLRGPPEVVAQALRMATLADRPIPALRVEVYSYVLRPNRDILSTRAQWQESQDSLSLSWTPPATSETELPLTLSFLGTDAKNQSLNLQVLHTRIEGKLLSRAELVVASGQTLKMQTGKFGYILVPQFENGTPIAVTEQVNTGNNLQVTPLLLPNGSVRLSIDVETSKFSESAAQATNTNLVANKNVNQRSITVQIPQDSLVVVGGLRRPQTNYVSNAALSGLRRVPILNRFLGTYIEDEELEQVMTLFRVSVHDGGLMPEKALVIPTALPCCDEPRGFRSLDD